MSSSESYSVIPDIRLLVDIGSANYTVPEAISELIANSMDARFENEALEIHVDVEMDSVSIVDNGKGMKANELGEAMRLSAIMDDVTGNTAERKGMYGLGMKAACSSLGHLWQIVTRPDGDKNQYSLTIDLKSWLKQTNRQAWVIDVVTSPYDEAGPLKGLKHGTSINVSSLRESFTMATAISEKLSMAYKPHLELGDKIFVNEEPVFPKQFNLLDNRQWEIDIPVGEYRVTGWFGLDSKTHNDGHYGINIYRLGQLVEPWNKDFFRAHLMSSRVVGEVDLPFVNANFHKKGFNKGSAEWKIVVEAMNAYMKPAVKASSDMAKNKNDDLRQAKAIKGLDMAMGVFNSSVLTSDASSKNNDLNLKSSVGESANNADAMDIEGTMFALNLKGENFTLVSKITELPDECPWDYIYDKANNELQAVINSSSRIYQEVNDEEFLGILALSEAVIGFLINERSYKYDDAREVRDRWLYLALSQRVKSSSR